MRVASSCGSEYVSAAHAGVQEQGELRFDLANRGTEAENVCIRGTPVGSFALPMVKVDGFIYWPKLIETEPQVRAYHYGTSQGFGTQFVLTFHGQAGPIEYTARLPLDADENGGGFLLSITDFHATDGDRHEVRFVWAMDADAGEDEVFQAYGQAPVLTETILPNPGQVANLAIGSHEHVIASEETGVQHTFDGRAPMDVVVYRTSTLLPQPALPPPVFHPIPEVWATPPEPLVGADVSFAVPHMMEGAYMGWMTDRGNLVDRGFAELPLGGGALVNAGFLIAQAYTGQLGYTGYHVVEGV